MHTKHLIDKVWIDDSRIYARTRDGLTASYRFADWKRLRDATPAELEDFSLSYCGIHWPGLDEDLSFEGMFQEDGVFYEDDD
jgi:hypothetical protein